jgi:hypothetical protein
VTTEGIYPIVVVKRLPGMTKFQSLAPFFKGFEIFSFSTNEYSATVQLRNEK